MFTTTFWLFAVTTTHACSVINNLFVCFRACVYIYVSTDTYDYVNANLLHAKFRKVKKSVIFKVGIY